ncbi:MAG: transcriptional regulator NrdR [Pseudomonadota bacterium]
MRCPYCASEATQVKDSRPVEDNTAIRRRRVCPDCEGRFTTHERVQLRELTVVKRSGRKVPFDRDKLLGSVVIALRKRPVDRDDMEQMVSEIVRELETRGDQEITSEDIGEAVMDALRGLDPVGYVRFASVYRDFREAADFEGVLGEIARDAVPPPVEPWLDEERARLAAAKAKRELAASTAPIQSARNIAQGASRRPVAAKKH